MPQNICFVKSNCPVLIDVLPCNVTTSWSSISKICLFDCSEWPSVFLPDLIHAPHTVQHDHTKSTASDVAVIKFGQLYLSWIGGCIANHSQYFCNYRMFLLVFVHALFVLSVGPLNPCQTLTKACLKDLKRERLVRKRPRETVSSPNCELTNWPSAAGPLSSFCSVYREEKKKRPAATM